MPPDEQSTPCGGAEPNWLARCIQRITGPPQTRVVVFGDFCLDAYWLIDPNESERSVETGLPVRRVRRQRYSPGGAGNVVANLLDLGVGRVSAVGIIGQDLFGRQLLEFLDQQGAKTSGMLPGQDDWHTPVYAKPCIGDGELNRMDFGAFNQIDLRYIDALAEQLESAAQEADVVILNQQLPLGVSTSAMIERINSVIGAFPAGRFIVDSRHRAGAYRGAMLKLNAHEAATLLGQPCPSAEQLGAEAERELAQRLFGRIKQPVFLTRGENGLIVVDATGLHEIRGIQAHQCTDPVGAGDTVSAALAAALAGGSPPAEAAALANIAAFITVRKLQTTGTATPEEIHAIGPDPEYLDLP